MKEWLPNMDLNHDKQIQSLLCYRYTIRQGGSQIYGVWRDSQVMDALENVEAGRDFGRSTKRRTDAALQDALATSNPAFD
jgi:hypothetical protein